jgi:transcriptional regulator with XRE-family HTH domain
MNIKDKRIKAGLSQQQLADKTGIPKDRIGKWEQGKGNPKAEDSHVLRDFFEKYVKEEVPRSGPAKQNHITTRNHLKEVGESKKGIMVYESAPVQAGIRTVYHDEHQVPDYVLNIPQFKDCNYGTRASGDSMYPEIRNGDLIVCKELPLDARIIFGDIYVVHTKDGIETIKYIQQFVDGPEEEPWVLLVPHNKAAGMGTPIPRKEITKLFKVRAIFKAY